MTDEETLKYLNYALAKGTLEYADLSLVSAGAYILLDMNRKLKEQNEQLRESLIRKESQ